MENVEGGRDMERGTWKGLCVCVCGSCAAASEGRWSKSTDKQSIKLTWPLFSPSLSPPLCVCLLLFHPGLSALPPSDSHYWLLNTDAFPIVQTCARFMSGQGVLIPSSADAFFFFCSFIKSGAELQIAVGSLGEIQSNQWDLL